MQDSLKIAHQQGIEVFFIPKKEKAQHPNSVRFVLTKGDRKMSVTGISIGGGNIQISELNGFKISLTMGTPTIVIVQQDVPGIIANVSQILFETNTNIGTMTVTRESKGEKAITIIEVDSPQVEQTLKRLRKLANIYSVNYFD